MNTPDSHSRLEMERAVLTRDRSCDGLFYVGVKTTGIFCRPVCPAKKPLRRNMEFFPGPREALFAGFRPCLRCRPMEASGSPPDWAKRLIELVEQSPGARVYDADVRRLGIDPARARRWFLREYRMTFHAYARGRRMADALRQIRDGARLEDVILGNGYESHSGFRERFSRLVGTPPGKSRDTDCLVTTIITTPIGPMVAAASGRGVCLLEFTDRRMLEREFAILRRRTGLAVLPGTNQHLAALRRELAAYFDGTLRCFTVPLDLHGTPFQKAVWSVLLTIPYGQTRSYEELARAAGHPGASRAAGTANGMNLIAIVVPCHRVINKGGGLGGYGGGLTRKAALIALERKSPSGQDRPLRLSAAAGDSGTRSGSSSTSKAPRSPSASLR